MRVLRGSVKGPSHLRHRKAVRVWARYATGVAFFFFCSVTGFKMTQEDNESSRGLKRSEGQKAQIYLYPIFFCYIFCINSFPMEEQRTCTGKRCCLSAGIMTSTLW